MRFTTITIGDKGFLVYNKETGLIVEIPKQQSTYLALSEGTVRNLHFVVFAHPCYSCNPSPQKIAEFFLCFLQKQIKLLSNGQEVFCLVYSSPEILSDHVCSALKEQKQKSAILKNLTFNCKSKEGLLEVCGNKKGGPGPSDSGFEFRALGTGGSGPGWSELMSLLRENPLSQRQKEREQEENRRLVNNRLEALRAHLKWLEQEGLEQEELEQEDEKLELEQKEPKKQNDSGLEL